MGGNVTTPKPAETAKVSRYEVQHSPAYGKPFVMMFYADTKEACEAWWATYGATQYPDGAMQIVKV